MAVERRESREVEASAEKVAVILRQKDFMLEITVHPPSPVDEVEAKGAGSSSVETSGAEASMSLSSVRRRWPGLQGGMARVIGVAGVKVSLPLARKGLRRRARHHPRTQSHRSSPVLPTTFVLRWTRVAPYGSCLTNYKMATDSCNHPLILEGSIVHIAAGFGMTLCLSLV